MRIGDSAHLGPDCSTEASPVIAGRINGCMKMTKSLVSFRDAVNTRSVISINEHIRGIIHTALFAEDEVLWDLITPRLQPPGVGGTPHYDHANIAFSVRAAAPELARVKGLNDKQVYDHTVEVLRKRGYLFARGYISGHVNEDATEADAEAETRSLTQ